MISISLLARPDRLLVGEGGLLPFDIACERAHLKVERHVTWLQVLAELVHVFEITYLLITVAIPG